MVGASLKSRSAKENCWFSIRTTPRSRGEDFKTQIEKNDVRITIASELPDLSQKLRRLARGKIEGADEAFYGRKCRSAPLWASGSGGGAFVGISYNRQAHTFPRHGKLFAEFSTLWKLFSRFFHSMENFLRFFPRYGKNYGEFSTLWKTFFHTVENGLNTPVFSLFWAVGSGLLSGARRAPCEP